MCKFYIGDVVKYIGESAELIEVVIEEVKTTCSNTTGLPIYYVRPLGWQERYSYGIHEENLTLIKRGRPNWEV